MLVKEVKEIARQWVEEEGSQERDFYGAYFAGSTNWMADDAVHPSTSDVDVTIIVQGPKVPQGHPRILYRDVLLEISYASANDFLVPETVLGNCYRAVHFTHSSIILDPSGHLTQIQAAVARDYAKRPWVRKRCEHAMNGLRARLQRLNQAELLHDQISAWLYTPGIPNHVILVAGLENPTVRRMFAASRTVLNQYDHLALHESLLSLLGSAALNRSQVELHLASLTTVFDAAKAVVQTPFFGAQSISNFARPLAIDGSRELIESGCHREAMFWIVVVFSWCQKALFNDAPVELQQRFTPHYQQLLSDLGISSFADLHQRNERLRSLLPYIWEVTEDIISKNPAIGD